MNEEEVKIKCILPWLKQAGVDLQDLKFEQNFNVKVGRQWIPIGEAHAKTRAGGRLDILVRRGDSNLFVVETKANDETLSDDDRDQAVSYARLVHPMAPYAIVTNGSKYRLYDSITKEEISHEAIRIRGFQAALPDAALAEAQKCFLGLNRSNLQRFCQQQVTSELRLVAGTLSEDRKFVRELHVSRLSIQKDLAEFYKSNQPGFLLLGESGSGKTCELCYIAETLAASGRPVLFLNGFSLAGDIPQAIANEFSWTFSGSDTPIEVLKRLESFVGNESLTIVVDAIDEWMLDSRTSHLGALLRAAENRKIKLILSCKSSVVQPFLFERGNATNVSLSTKRVEMPTLSAKEFFDAVENYRQAYGFSGAFEDAVLNEARENPFLLRVLFDVARDHNLTHLTFNAAQFLEEYYQRSLRKTCDKHQAEDTLIATARLLYERNTDLISEHDVKSTLGLRANDALMEELFEYGLLVRTSPSIGKRFIRFYFQQLRDYIIAFGALQLNKMQAADLKREFDSVTFPSTRGEVFTLYYRLAPRDQQVIFDGEVRESATRYLKLYISLIQRHFPALRSNFGPRTDKTVGFVGELILPLRSVGLHGFRPLNAGDEEVHFVPLQQPGRESNLASLAGVRGGMHLRSSARGFKDGINVSAEVVDFELLPQIRDLVKTGQLNESNSPDLLVELITESVLVQRDIFRPLLAADRRSIQYPLNLDAVLRCLSREKLTRHFHDEIVRRKRRTGEIREQWNGSFVSYSYSRTPADDAEVVQKVNETLAHGEMPVFRARYVELEHLEERLGGAINILRATRQEIVGPLLSGLERLITIRDPAEFWRSADQLKEALRTLYLKFLYNYKCLVETNFPTLRKHFRLYTETPQSFYLTLGAPAGPNFDIPLTILVVKSASGESTVEFVDEIVREGGDRGGEYEIDGIVYRDALWIRTTVRRFASNHAAFGRMHLRAFVYGRIHEELAAVEKAFRSSVEVGQGSPGFQGALGLP